jgi:hypothetical protein
MERRSHFLMLLSDGIFLPGCPSVSAYTPVHHSASLCRIAISLGKMEGVLPLCFLRGMFLLHTDRRPAASLEPPLRTQSLFW